MCTYVYECYDIYTFAYMRYMYFFSCEFFFFFVTPHTKPMRDSHEYICIRMFVYVHIGWLRLAGSFKLWVSLAEYRLFLQGSFAKETYNFKESTDRSHPMCECVDMCT